MTFECEPGTLTEAKLAAIRRMGVTRLSLGVENFNDRILELNGRAHRSPEVFRAYEQARALDFPQINIDLIAGMLGETEENWQRVRAEDGGARSRQRDHLPDGAPIQHRHQRGPAERDGTIPGAGRGLVDEAAMGARGVRGARGGGLPRPQRVHRREGSVAHTLRLPDRLWQGADMVGLGVASFGHINGVHVQNLDTWETYSDAIRGGEHPA